MSRIRSTLDTVSKAVSGTDLLSKITRLRSGKAAAAVEVHVHGPTNQETATVAMMATAVPPGITMEMPEQEKRHEEEVVERVAEEVEVPHIQVREKLKVSLASQAGTVSAAVAKQTLQRLQPAAFSTNMDETYSHLSQHVNTYFGSDAPPEPVEQQWAQQRRSPDPAASAPGANPTRSLPRNHTPVMMPVVGKRPIETSPELPAVEHTTPATSTPATLPTAPKSEDVAPVQPASPRKGISHYLSYPRPSVQSFVGSYIAPLVPKFRADSKNAAADKDKPSGSEQVNPREGEEKSKEEKDAEDKAQRLLSQRERVGLQKLITSHYKCPHRKSIGGTNFSLGVGSSPLD